MLEPCVVKNAAAIGEPRLLRLYEYWNEKRGLRKAPLRNDIDPVEIPELLGFLNLYDVRGEPRDYFVRLNGSEIANMLCRDVTGKLSSEVLDGEDRARCHKAFSICIENWQPALVETSMGFCDKPYAIQTVLALPLSSDGIHVDMIVSGHAFRAKNNLRPRGILHREIFGSR